MSRIAKNINQWGTGDLNGAPSTPNKVNGEQIKRYGALGVGGVAGVVKNHGAVHEMVFELTGDEIWKENGVNVTNAMITGLPAFSLIEEVNIVIHEPFAAGSVVILDSEIQASAGAGLGPANLVSGQSLDLRAIVKHGQLAPPADFALGTIGARTFELGGTVFVDFNTCEREPTSQSGGRAEIILTYRTL